jgi:hypothetical protein
MMHVCGYQQEPAQGSNPSLPYRLLGEVDRSLPPLRPGAACPRPPAGAFAKAKSLRRVSEKCHPQRLDNYVWMVFSRKVVPDVFLIASSASSFSAYSIKA